MEVMSGCKRDRAQREVLLVRTTQKKHNMKEVRPLRKWKPAQREIRSIRKAR